MNNNGRKSKVRERLAYMFAGGFIGYMGARLGLAALGIQIPEQVMTDIQIFGALAGNIIAFFFGSDVGKEKPES